MRWKRSLVGVLGHGPSQAPQSEEGSARRRDAGCASRPLAIEASHARTSCGPLKSACPRKCSPATRSPLPPWRAAANQRGFVGHIVAHHDRAASLERRQRQERLERRALRHVPRHHLDDATPGQRMKWSGLSATIRISAASICGSTAGRLPVVDGDRMHLRLDDDARVERAEAAHGRGDDRVHGADREQDFAVAARAQLRPMHAGGGQAQRIEEAVDVGDGPARDDRHGPAEASRTVATAAAPAPRECERGRGPARYRSACRRDRERERSRRDCRAASPLSASRGEASALQHPSAPKVPRLRSGGGGLRFANPTRRARDRCRARPRRGGY